MQFDKIYNAERLALAALIVWCVSLVLPAIVLYGKHEIIYGYNILLMGWLSPLIGNFAWLANIFFIAGIFRLRGGRVISTAAYLAILLSLDTFRFREVPLNEGGATAPVYGYGWGAVLWFAAICLLVSAAGARQIEKAEDISSARMSGFKLRSVGLGLSLAVIIIAGLLAIYQRLVANTAEYERLDSVAVKWGQVCSVPDPVVAEPIIGFTGVLEVVTGKNYIQARYPFNQVKTLLSWGIPIVRLENTDYSYGSHGADVEPMSVPASGPPAAVLYVREEGADTVRAMLVEAKSNRTVFDQSWVREVRYNYCPDYKSFPGAKDQPRRVIMQALGLSDRGSQADAANQKTPRIDIVQGVVLSVSDGAYTRKMMGDAWRRLHPDKPEGPPFHEVFNRNCPDDIGWEGGGYDSSSGTGWPFMVRGKAYYLTYRKSYNATCDGDVVYIYAGSALRGGYHLNIEKRSLDDFAQIWKSAVRIASTDVPSSDNAVTVQSVEIVKEGMLLTLVNESSGRVLLVRVPVPRDGRYKR